MIMQRRTVLRLAGVGLSTTAIGLSPLTLSRSWAVDEFETLLDRWRTLATGGDDVDPSHPAIAARLAEMDNEAGALWSSLLTAADRDRLWDDLPITGPNVSNIALSFSRLGTLAKAWATQGSALTGEEVAATLASALRFLHDHGYNASMRPSGNWWFWEIGNPRQLLDACCLLGDQLPAEDLADYVSAVREFAPDPNFRGTGTSFAETGANRADKAVACAVRGLLDKDASEVALARDALSDTVGHGAHSLFQYVTQGDGFYRDGSFVQHDRLPYVGTYGNVALKGSGQLMTLLSGSRWEITDPDQTVLLDAPEKSFAPFIWNGLMMDTVRGRAVSRSAARDYQDAFSTISSLTLLANAVSATYRDRYRSLARGWIERAPHPYLEHASIPEIVRALEVLNDASVTPAPEPVGHQHFADQDRAVHRRPGWAFTVSISSKRIGRYEWGNNENNLGWYQGDGMTYLYVDSDPTQFSDDFWPTVDPYRLPGTTVGTERRTSGEGDGTGIPAATQPWAGGSSLFGRYGAIGMDHLAYDKTLSAKKSWFCLDDAIVALGAGIASTDEFPIRTVVENRNQHVDGSAAFEVDAAAAPRWAHLDGVGGYLFPAGGKIQTQSSSRTGSWREINSGGDTAGDPTPIDRHFASLLLDHGVDPHDASYQYVLLPKATAERTRALSSDVPFAVLTNTSDVQAIKVPIRRGHLIMANFFAAGQLDDLKASGPCSVIIAWEGRDITIAVSDPSRTQQQVRLTVPRVRSSKLTTADDTMSVTSFAPLTIQATLSGTRGATQTIAVAR